LSAGDFRDKGEARLRMPFFVSFEKAKCSQAYKKLGKSGPKITRI
jgi:hypothetical protein